MKNENKKISNIRPLLGYGTASSDAEVNTGDGVVVERAGTHVG
jgi:hypothetical protein